MSTTVPANIDAYDRSFFGHPRGLATCFFTEMWERFGYYGMRAILILFMTASVASGGLGFDDGKAGSIYGLYTASAYLLCLPGGWIADRIMGQRRAVLWGGIVMAFGYTSLSLPGVTTFYVGLVLVACGTGLLKANISTMVGQLYGTADARRDAAFSIFYVGINIGALIAPIICGYLAQRVNWHYGFAAAAVGIVIGLIQYVWGGKYLAPVSSYPVPPDSPEAGRKQMALFRWTVLGVLAVAMIIALLVWTGVIGFSAQGVANVAGVALVVIVPVFFLWLLTVGSHTPMERKRMLAVAVLFIAAALFWAAYEQAGSTLNLFADRNTRCSVLGYSFPASWFQSFNSFFIMGLAPIFAWIWVKLGPRNPSSPAKFALGLIFVGLGFAILIPVASHTAVGPGWLTATYFLHTVGELLLSPVGLSAMTKLAPARLAGLILGVWFLATSVGDYISGRLASFYDTFPLPQLFGTVALFAIVVGLILALLVKPMKRLMGGVN
jgi:POT family proton-dependent oligopeptide transporter